MSAIAKLAVCGLVIVALTVPAFAGGPRHTKASEVFGKVRGAGITAVEQTEGLISGCLKRTFSLFNPCLDFVKGCTNVVMAPIERPFDYMEGKLSKPKHARKAQCIPEPKKPEIPK